MLSRYPFDLSAHQEHYYLPMHGVTKASSTTTKLRVVFDASAKTTNQLSLNDLLHAGPTLHPTLEHILLQFRTHSIAVTADISKMYRAVHLHPQDRDLHRFLWREDPSLPMKDFRMTRVTFGVTASPYLAIKTLQHTSHDFKSQYPLAAPIVLTSFYVDDLLTGAETPEQAIDLFHSLRGLLAKGGFDLRKWRSSSTTVLNAIDPSLHEQVPVQDLVSQIQSPYPKALGMEWDSSQDVMSTSLSLPSHYASTKRGIISDIARTFDVLGSIAPTIAQMKIMYQEVWEIKLGWDDVLPDQFVGRHATWRQELPALAERKQPRCYYAKGVSRVTTELHGFCDASTHAYAAVVYVRATYVDHPTTCTLVTAKTRVAPLKPLSIPRLELCGANLLAKLLTSVRRALSVPLTQVYAWSDSTIVLSWLDGHPKRFKTFVGNRLSSILTELPSSTWHHVPTAQNPADCASRGLSPVELVNHSLWWEGPTWLHSNPLIMPNQPLLGLGAVPELKAVCAVSQQMPICWIENLSNSYYRIIRITAWCLRYLSNLKQCRNDRAPTLTNHLTVSELNAAERFLFHEVQSFYFPNELYQLTHDHSIASSSSIMALTPFIDEHGLLRVGGRLTNSHLHRSQTHPIILHGRSTLCHKLMSYKHASLGHCGPSLLLSSVGTQVHIVGARRLARSVFRSCVVCRRATARTQQQLMGQLPSSRITPAPPFSTCGVDYAGPFLLKKGHTRKPVIVKGYMAVFICFSTKAVHLEPVSDATTRTFIECLKRFVSRRGCPGHIYSDNGGNFVGARRELQEFYSMLNRKDTTSAITNYLLDQRVQWHASPERAPHFGGLWEAAVKSAKLHLKKVVGAQRLTYEEFHTILTQVEACLNSRPLFSVSSQSLDGIDMLTPAHFLIQRPSTAYPEEVITSEPSLHRRWTMTKSIIHHFWRRWSADYLQHLQKLSKWRKPTLNLRIGDVVLIKEDLTFAQQWPMARVIATHPGQDGLVRAVTIKTERATYKRPMVKLVLLLSQEEADSARSQEQVQASASQDQEQDHCLIIHVFLFSPPPQYVQA